MTITENLIIADARFQAHESAIIGKVQAQLALLHRFPVGSTARRQILRAFIGPDLYAFSWFAGQG